ncbi:MAG: hypothetical protein KGV50_04360 [Gammaproteobacteria bacterium]|nr:hypothetical protein [Gammaproteobacteria bacterium]
MTKNKFIENLGQRRQYCFDKWEEIISDAIDKNKYSFAHGNDVFIHDFDDNDCFLLSKFFYETAPYIKHNCKMDNSIPFDKAVEQGLQSVNYTFKGHTQENPLLCKHIFDY